MAKAKVFKIQTLTTDRQEIPAAEPVIVPDALRELLDLVPGMLSLVDTVLDRVDQGKEGEDEILASRLLIGDVGRIVQAVTAYLDGHAVSVREEPMLEEAVPVLFSLVNVSPEREGEWLVRELIENRATWGDLSEGLQ